MIFITIVSLIISVVAIFLAIGAVKECDYLTDNTLKCLEINSELMDLGNKVIELNESLLDDNTKLRNELYGLSIVNEEEEDD